MSTTNTLRSVAQANWRSAYAMAGLINSLDDLTDDLSGEHAEQIGAILTAAQIVASEGLRLAEILQSPEFAQSVGASS